MPQPTHRFGTIRRVGSGCSSYIGVSRNGLRWKAAIYTNGKSRYLGTYATDLEAAAAYDNAVRSLKIKDKKRVLNFPTNRTGGRSPPHTQSSHSCANDGDNDDDDGSTLSKAKDSGDSHNSLCQACGLGGELLCCDYCNLVYHLGCLTPPLETPPSGKWSCPVCTKMDNQLDNLLDNSNESNCDIRNDDDDEWNPVDERRRGSITDSMRENVLRSSQRTRRRTTSRCYRWFEAKANDTPFMIAEWFGIDVKELVALNKLEYPSLRTRSKLLEGTELRMPPHAVRQVQ